MDIVNGVTEWLFKYGLYIAPIPLIIFVVHIIKGFIPETFSLKKTMTILICLVISYGATAAMYAVHGFDLFSWIFASLIYWTTCCVLTVFNDILIKEGVYQKLLDLILKIINKKFGGKE